MLTNPFYAGRLRTGKPSALVFLVDPATWEHVQAMRARYSRRHRGSVNRRQYGPGGLLACAACGRRLIGNVGRYRHTDACEVFRAAAPRRSSVTARRATRGCGASRAKSICTSTPSVAPSSTSPSRRGSRPTPSRKPSTLRVATSWYMPGSSGSASASRCSSRTIAISVGSGPPWPASTPKPRLSRVAAGPVGPDLGRWTTNDRRGRVRADRYPWGERLHVHADRPRASPGLGRGFRRRRLPREKNVRLVGARVVGFTT